MGGRHPPLHPTTGMTVAVAMAPSHHCPCPLLRQRPSTILVLLVPPADTSGLLALGMGFCPTGPLNGAWGPGDPNVPMPKVSGLAAEPLGGLPGAGPGGPGGSSIRNAAAPNVTSRGAAAPQRGRLSPAAWAAAVALPEPRGWGQGGDTPPKLPPHPQTGWDVAPAAAGPDPAWRGAGAADGGD